MKYVSITSPAKKVQTVLIPQKLKSSSVSPKKNDLEKGTSNITIESPRKKLVFHNDDDNTKKTTIKRKILSTNTPENKKFKVDLIQSPDTQVSNIIFLSFVLFKY